jgi:hypothetical protein
MDPTPRYDSVEGHLFQRFHPQPSKNDIAHVKSVSWCPLVGISLAVADEDEESVIWIQVFVVFRFILVIWQCEDESV